MKKTVFPKKNVHFFGLDFLELIYPREALALEFAPIDMDNSSFAYMDFEVGEQVFQCKYDRFTPQGYDYGYRFQTVYAGRIVDAFAYLFGVETNENGRMESRDRLVLYSGFFVLAQNGHFTFTISDFLRKYFPATVFPSQITRLDIALDTDIELPKLLKFFDKVPEFHSSIGLDALHE
jgi:hypothetical protein